MLRYFSVKNYKNFREKLVLDFTKVHDYQFNSRCVKNGLISKAIIYGKNSEGKTNLFTAVGDITYTMRNYWSSLDMRNNRYMFKNANAGLDELVEFHYSFLLDGKVVDYIYFKTDAVTVVAEKFLIDGKVIFEYDRQKDLYDFTNVGLVHAETLNWDDFRDGTDIDNENNVWFEKPAALRLIVYNTIQEEKSVINQLAGFIGRMRFSTSSQNSNYLIYSEQLSEEEKLKKFQQFLNEHGVECDLILLENPEGKKDIYYNYKKPLQFFSNMSSGTAALTNFYLNFMNKGKTSFIFIDEFDANYHFELSEKIVTLLEEQFDCQVVLTSHNTGLLSNSIMRPDCFMILSNGKLTPICEATTRELRQGHNLQKLYRNGEFDG